MTKRTKDIAITEEFAAPIRAHFDNFVLLGLKDGKEQCVIKVSSEQGGDDLVDYMRTILEFFDD